MRTKQILSVLFLALFGALMMQGIFLDGILGVFVQHVGAGLIALTAFWAPTDDEASKKRALARWAQFYGASIAFETLFIR